MFPFVFGDDTNIPESGNGTPDVLDEVKWELDWMLKMQDSESGGFYHLRSTRQLPGKRLLQARGHHRAALRRGPDGRGANVTPTATTAKAVAALAHASP